MKKKILFKLWQFPRLSETFILAQIITAIKCNYEVKILVGELLDVKISTHEHLIKKYCLLEKIIYEDYKIPKNQLKRILKAIYILFINSGNLFNLYEFLRNYKNFELKHIFMFHFYFKLIDFDILHVQYGTNCKPLDFLKKSIVYPAKLIVSFHGHDLYFPINGVIQNNGYYDKLFEVADLLIANTPFLKDTLIDLGADKRKIKTIPVGVNTSFFRKEKDQLVKNEKFEIITVGRLEKFKGQLLGLQCVKKLKEIGYNIHYTLIGTGSQEKILHKYVEQNDLTQCVCLMGRKSQYEIRNYLKTQDLFLMTSVTDPDYGVESQGLVTAEAQACGLPVIGFDSGGVKYTIKNEVSGYLVPEYDVNLMTKYIEYLINNPETRLKMGEEAVNFVKKEFSQNKIDKIWCKTYQSLLNN